MHALENNTAPSESLDISFGRKLNANDHLKDRLIIKHLRRHKNNFLLDFDEPQNNPKEYGATDE